MGTFFPFEAALVSQRETAPPAAYLTLAQEGVTWECVAERRHIDAEWESE